MDSNLKRLVSSLSNSSKKFKTPYIIYDDYCIINNKVYKRKDIGRDIIWKETDENYQNVLEKAGLTKKLKKNKKVSYLAKIETVYQKYISYPKTNESPVIIPDNNADKKKKIIENYERCFVGGGEKNQSTIFELGKFIYNYGEKNSIKAIFNKKYRDLSGNEAKKKKSEIQKNIKGTLRFLVFAERLPSGVYQLARIPITYFVKVTNDEWHEFKYGRNKILDYSESESGNLKFF